MEATARGNRYRRRQQKRSAEKAISGKIISATRVIEFKSGARYPVKVQSPHTAHDGTTHMVYYTATLVVDDDGRTRLVDIEGYTVPRYAEADYYATVEIPGYSDWQMISNIPVQISRHTLGKVYTKCVMDDLERHGTESRL